MLLTSVGDKGRPLRRVTLNHVYGIYHLPFCSTLTLYWVTTSQIIECKSVPVFSIEQSLAPEWPINRGLEGWLRSSRQYIEPFGQECTIKNMKEGRTLWKGILFFHN